ncbi:MAG: hypothetical protein HXX14_03015 [Bacteroidetes bacterium]|nr:hypothetical protein [Bacteroidota bacterium]
MYKPIGIKNDLLLMLILLLFFAKNGRSEIRSSCQKMGLENSDSILIRIRVGYEQRRALAFERLHSKPLVREAVMPPIFPGGSNFSRNYSYSLIDFAFKCFWLNEQIGAANSALIENCNYYIGYPQAYKDKDSFYWASDELCRIIEFFGSRGALRAGLVSKEAEEKIFLMMWQYSKTQSKVVNTEYKISKTWHIDESENHHIQRFYCAWHFAKFLKEQLLYKNLKYDDGFTASEHFAAWNDYIKQWILERGRRGLFIEMANDGYGLETLKGIYNFYDFGTDKQLRELSGKLLDFYWAVWAQEQLNGVRGGGKSRVYPEESSRGRTPFWKMAWYYLGINELSVPEGNLYTLITSNYRMPLVVMDIALDIAGRKNYEITQRQQGLAEKGFFTPPVYHLAENGGLVRYSYCTPEFIAGTLLCDARPYEDWTMISSQNRWVGVIFNGNPDSRIYAQCQTGKDQRAYNQFWCVQKKGSIIVQKLKDQLYSRGAGKMQLWISKINIGDLVEKNGWVFMKTNGSYTAIKCIDSDYSWKEMKMGNWLVCNKDYSPVILEVARQVEFTDYDAFQKKVLKLKYTLKNELLTYSSLNGDILTLSLDYKDRPTVNGVKTNLEPDMGIISPFVQSQFDSGIIKIVKDNRNLVLDFKLN